MALLLHEQPDPEQTAERLLEFARKAIDARHVGVVLLQRGGRLESAAASDAVVEEADRLQAELGEGPSLTAIESEHAVVSGSTAVDHRWPSWSLKAAALGVCSVLSVRMRASTAAVGALNLFDPATDRFTSEDIAVAQVLAGHAAVAVANARSESTLWEAIDARKLVGQAQGILMERFDLTDEQAFAVLRRYSQARNVKLRDVAQRLIATRRLP